MPPCMLVSLASRTSISRIVTALQTVTDQIGFHVQKTMQDFSITSNTNNSVSLLLGETINFYKEIYLARKNVDVSSIIKNVILLLAN